MSDLTIGGDDYLATVERQRAEALAEVERLNHLVRRVDMFGDDVWKQLLDASDKILSLRTERAEALATIERVKALIPAYEQSSGSAWAYVVKDLRAALERPVQPAKCYCEDGCAAAYKDWLIEQEKARRDDPADLKTARDRTDLKETL